MDKKTSLLVLAVLLLTHFVGAVEQSGILIEFDIKKIEIKTNRRNDDLDAINTVITINGSVVKEKALPEGVLTFSMYVIELRSAVTDSKQITNIEKDYFDAIFEQAYNFDFDRLFLENKIVLDAGNVITVEVTREYGTIHGEKKQSKQVVLFGPYHNHGNETKQFVDFILEICDFIDFSSFVRNIRKEEQNW